MQPDASVLLKGMVIRAINFKSKERANRTPTDTAVLFG